MATTKKIDTSNVKTMDDFKQSMIDLGIKLCDEITAGQARNNEANLNAIIGLYNAIKA